MTAPRIISSQSRPRGGVTLIELLVVITVIGILAALLIPTVGGLLRTSGELAIANNIQQLEGAIEKFKGEFGFYPSDFSEFVDSMGNPLDFGDPVPGFGVDVQTRLKQFLAKISPTHNEDEEDPVLMDGSTTRLENWWNEVGKLIASNSAASTVRAERLRGPEVAMWFWLSQINNDAQYPFSGARDTSTPDANVIVSARKVFFDFGKQLDFLRFPDDSEQTADYASSVANAADPYYARYRMFRVIQSGGDAPLTYFHHATYLDPTSTGPNPIRTRVDYLNDRTNPDATIENWAEPVMESLPVDPLPVTTTSQDFYKPNSFQIGAAGWNDTYRDINEFSGTVTFRTIEYYEARDNLYDFTEGRADKFFDLP